MNKISEQSAEVVAGCQDVRFAKRVLRLEWWMGFLYGAMHTIAIVLAYEFFRYASR